MSDSSPGLEKAILACPLVEPDTLTLVASMSIEDFTVPYHRVLLGAYQAMVAEGVLGIDLLILKDWLERHGIYDNAGGIEYLAALDLELPAVTSLPQYIRELERCRRRREVRVAAAAVAESPTEEVITNLREAMAGLDGTGDVRLSDGAALAQLLTSDHREATLPSGMQRLDAMLGGGFADGQLIIVAALTGYGKSALAGQWAIHAACTEKMKVAFFSLEMTVRDMACRLASQISKVPWTTIRDRDIPEMQAISVGQAQDSISRSGLLVDDRSNLSLTALSATCREAQRSGLDLVVVDYLQLMNAPKRDNRSLEVGSLTRGLKILAKDLGVPVIAISQLNRAASHTSSRPQLHNLKETSSIEQDADVVIFVHKDSIAETDCDLVIGKNRHGEVGTISMEWDGPSMSFYDQQEGPVF